MREYRKTQSKESTESTESTENTKKYRNLRKYRNYRKYRICRHFEQDKIGGSQDGQQGLTQAIINKIRHSNNITGIGGARNDRNVTPVQDQRVPCTARKLESGPKHKTISPAQCSKTGPQKRPVETSFTSCYTYGGYWTTTKGTAKVHHQQMQVGLRANRKGCSHNPGGLSHQCFSSHSLRGVELA